jgi:hypothetical protein
VLHFDGTPITGRFIVRSISQHLEKRQSGGSKPTARNSETSA